jgi:threonylcarbamoyladenosine tRNA methylthiotransferase MtaB
LLYLHCGCKVNQYETNAIAQKFIEKGYKKVEFDTKADIYIINTCTVTSMADKKSRQIIRQAKTRNENATIVATGCYAQISKAELEKMDELDIIVGNSEKNKIVDIVENYSNEKKQEVGKIEEEKEFQDFGTVTYTEKTRAVIKVQDGCNNFCSYCIIPYAKGRVRSRKPESVINEIKNIVKKGTKEVVITGIHVASYGKDFEDGTKLIDLLEQINKIDGLKRIRLGSLEPNLITEEFVERLGNVEKICDHFHLSLQSGCDETLKRMNRKYTIEEFEKGVKLLRNKFPNVALTTDIIVGFPGETEEEFEKTYKFLKNIKFSKMHIFKYSQRKGTVAAKMKEQISPEIKEKRSNKLIELSNKNEIEFLNQYINQNLEVLFETKTEGDYTEGHTTNYITVKVKAENIENSIENVKIIKREDMELIGNIKQS